MSAVSARTRELLGGVLIDHLEDEHGQRPSALSEPDLHVAVMHGVVRVLVDLILAVPEIGPASAGYVGQWIEQQIVDGVGAGRMPARVH